MALALSSDSKKNNGLELGISSLISAFDNVISLTTNTLSEDAARLMCNAYIMIFNNNDGDI